MYEHSVFTASPHLGGKLVTNVINPIFSTSKLKTDLDQNFHIILKYFRVAPQKGTKVTDEAAGISDIGNAVQ